MLIYKLIECAFDFVVDGSTPHNDDSLTMCNSSSLGAQFTEVTSLLMQFKGKGALQHPHLYTSVSHHII